MWIFRERRDIILNLKFVQIIFNIIVLTTEIIQYAIYSNIKSDSPDVFAVNWFINNEYEAIKIWDYIVFSLTLIALGAYVYYFKRIWNKGPYLSLDLSLAVLWTTTAISNLDPAFGRHPVETCSTAQTFSLTTICRTWMISAVFCWSNMLIFIISAFITWRVKQEKRKGIYSFHKPATKLEVKNRTSQRQSVLLKQGLENPDKSQPVMLESGIKPLMLVQLANT
uniref:Peptide chain release factor 3 n=1 Tax=Anthurium amnicola TaxID=1678845 RepID=A0A1D1YIN4_9ARAE